MSGVNGFASAIPQNQPVTISTPAHQHQITFNPPAQPFTASAPPSASAATAPSHAPIITNTSSTAAAPALVGQGLAAPPTAPTDQGRALRKRAPTTSYTGADEDDAAEQTTRSGRSFAGKPMPTTKLKLTVKPDGDGRKQSFLGPYDRDLDSEEDELVFEEHFILRMPEGKEANRLRDMVGKRQAMPDVWFKFKDNKRAVFHIGDSLHPAKLMDLPCILESQKTLDNKHMFKVADIHQVLVVEDTTLPNEEALLAKKTAFKTDEFLYPHGLTPPLRHVRKRRFNKKRLNRAAIEIVENEVDRLLNEEKGAANVEEIIFEDADLDLSDSEYLARVMPAPPTPDEDEPVMKEEDEDEAFAAQIAAAFHDEEEEESDEDEGSDEDDQDGDNDEDQDQSGSESASGSGSDEDDDDEEYSGAKKLVDDEIRQLESAIAKKNADIAKVTNAALKNRFINAVAKMQADLDAKMVLREQLLAEHRAAREREALEDADDEEGSDDEEGPSRAVVATVPGVADVAAAGGADEYYGGQAMDIS